MKILILTSRFPYPIEKGDKLRIYHQIRYLSERHEIVLCSLTEFPIDPEHRNELKKYCSRIEIFQISKFDIARGLAASLFNGLPFQVSYFWNRKVAQKLHACIDQENPDQLFGQLIRTSEYIRTRKEKKYIDYMDAFSDIAFKMIGKSPWYSKWIWKWESKKLKRYEQQIFKDFNSHSLISKRDLQKMNIPEKGVGIIPNGVDYDFFAAHKSPYKNYDLVFVGNMGYAPNVDAVQFIVKKIMPLVWEKLPGCKLLIAGARPSQEVQDLANPLVTISGWIEDIRDAYGSARIFVAPIFLGAGQQNKIMEAMASGIPCITSSNVNMGIGAKPGETILIAEEANEYASHIFDLLEKENQANKIAQAAKKFVQTNFSWSKNVEKLEQLISS